MVTVGSSGTVWEGGDKFWPRESNLRPFSTLSTDLDHFILKLLNFHTLILCLFLYLFSRLGGAKQATLCLWGGPWP